MAAASEFELSLATLIDIQDLADGDAMIHELRSLQRAVAPAPGGADRVQEQRGALTSKAFGD